MEKEKIDRSVAVAEVEKWLDKKKVLQSVKEQFQDNIDLLADAISEGHLILGEDFTFKHTLLHPFGEEEKVTELTYKSRLNDKMLKPYLNGVKIGDSEGRFLAYIAALTSQPRGVLENMDSVDKKISMAIAVFFL